MLSGVLNQELSSLLLPSVSFKINAPQYEGWLKLKLTLIGIVNNNLELNYTVTNRLMTGRKRGFGTYHLCQWGMTGVNTYLIKINTIFYNLAIWIRLTQGKGILNGLILNLHLLSIGLLLLDFACTWYSKDTLSLLGALWKKKWFRPVSRKDEDFRFDLYRTLVKITHRISTVNLPYSFIDRVQYFSYLTKNQLLVSFDKYGCKVAWLLLTTNYSWH